MTLLSQKLHICGLVIFLCWLRCELLQSASLSPNTKARIVIAWGLHDSYFPPSARICAANFAFKSMVGHWTLEGMELVLLIRRKFYLVILLRWIDSVHSVHAFYKCKRSVGIFLGTLFSVGLCLRTYADMLSIISLTSAPSCNNPPKSPSLALIIFGQV